ncbi:MAG: AMP-binding protein [Acidimicrobiia bacterium]|nr:AMP-binding protein [Acidimicrobiia bacterium]
MLGATIREAAARFDGSTAYVAPAGWPISYADLDRISDEAAMGLAARGVGLGDVVALVLAPGPEYLALYLAAAKLGAVTAGVNDRLTEGERVGVLERATPRLVIGAVGAVPSAFDGLELAPAGSTTELLADLRVAGDPPPPLPDDPERPVTIVFTSGTTGAPKGALYCNRQLAFITANDVGDAWGGGGRGFTGTSFAHLGFMTKLAGNLRRGGVNFIMTRWSAKGALALLEREHMHAVAGVPAQIALMLRRPDFDDYDLSSVQYIVVGGGPVTPGLAEEARARFGAKLATRYSCTEAGIGLGTAFDDPDEDAIVSVGRPHAAVELALLDDDDRTVAAGEVGAVCLRSPAVMSGYWGDPEGTRAAFTSDGFVRTGDLGWVDDQGRLRLVGRSKEMYVRGGYNVYPVEVEGVLSRHPDVAAVAITPRPDPVMGEIGVAVVVARDPGHPPTLESLRAHATEHLAAYKLPEDLRLIDALPLTAAEKVDRAALRHEP